MKLMCHPEQAKRVEGSLAAFLVAILFTACGESSTTEKIVEVATGGTEIVESVKNLPKCTKNNQGEQALVKGESSVRICVDGKWFATKESAKDSAVAGNFCCSTKELKDKSGLKIICNGDSIGVVLNGAKGETGAAGKDGEKGTDGKQGEKGDDGIGCSIASQTDSLVTIKCGDKSMTLNLRANGVTVDTTSVDTLELDSEKVAVSLDTLSGVSQKGPFLKGSTVYLYELSDGRTLKQTNGNFTSEIKDNDGRYKFTSRNLVSQYALLVADGKYRNEVTGKPTNTAIKLQAYTNMLSRRSANVNLLTHLEKDRVYYLVTREKMSVRAAKRQAQAEILDAFHIDASNFKTESEDLDVFGKTDADAALLAISILLQRDSSETELSVLLTDMADDLAEDGVWNNAAKRAEIADWAAIMDSSISTSASKLAVFRNNVRKWGLGGGNVPDFEKFVRLFWSDELGLGVCGSDSIPVGTVKNVSNKKSNRFYASGYTDAGNKVRFICDNASLSRWRAATDIEKDTMGWASKFKDAKDGDIRTGDVTQTKKYDYDGNLQKWRYATPQEGMLGGCIEARETDLTRNTGFYNGKWYICKNREWVSTNEITVDTQGWEEGSDGDLKKGDSTDIFYKYDEASDTWVTATHNDTTLKLMGCTINRTGEIGKSSTNDTYYVCKSMNWQVAEEIDYDTYGEKCSADSVGKVVSGVVTSTNKYYCAVYVGVDDDFYYEWVNLLYWSWVVPKEVRMNSNVEYGSMTDNRDQKVYRTVKIGDQVWMAENLNYADSNKTPSLNGRSWCNNDKTENCSVTGRLYTWAAAIDSVKLATDADNPQDCGYGKNCSLSVKVQGICPPGWHVPMQEEWASLIATVGGYLTAGKILKSQTGWMGWNENANGTDAFGFSALPAGRRNAMSIDDNAGIGAYFWSSSHGDSGYAFIMELYNGNGRVDEAGLGSGDKSYGYSVRCLQD